MMDEAAGRVAVVETCREMARRGLVTGTSGNVSVRCGAGLLISPTGVGYPGLQPEQVVFLRPDGGFDGPVLPSSEWHFHQAVLQARQDLHAVVHTHSRQATAVSVLGHAIPAIHYMVAAAGGPTIPCAPYATFGTPELARSVAAAMADRRACLLAHHGAVAAGVTAAAALDLAELVEEMAALYLLCLPVGPPPILPAAEMALVAEKFRHYGQQPGPE